MSIQSFFNSRTSPSKRRPARRSLATRLSVELLEDRCQPSFLGPVSYTAGTNPHAVVTADFNADGHLDLAVANYSSSSVNVLLGNPNGTFQPALSSATGGAPLSLAVGDFNEDGMLDLATTNLGGVSVLRGNGNGTFQPAANSIPVGEVPDSLAVGDFNGDGNLDLAVTTQTYYPDYPYLGGLYASNAVVLMGNGTGSFAPPTVTPLSSYYGYYYNLYDASTVVSDFNGDGKQDLAFANTQSGSVAVLLGSATGLGGPATLFTVGPAVAITAGDMNADGKIDLVTAHAYTDNLAVLLGNGLGSFGPAQTVVNVSPIHSLATANFNTDGHVDLVLTNPVAGTVSVLLGTGAGAFKPPVNVTTAAGPLGVAVGDFNGDGRPDVATNSFSSNNVSVLLNDGIWPALNAPSLTITDVTVAEGNLGTTNATFTVTLSAAYAQPVSVHYATADYSATVAGGDYQAISGTLTFNPGGPLTQTLTVPVNGDRIAESTESFLLRLSDPVNAFVADASGTGTIVDDEPSISIIDAVLGAEGNTGTSALTFTVTLSALYDADVTVAFATADLTPDEEYWYGLTSATAGVDYVAHSGTLTIPAGQLSAPIPVQVIGDRVGELDEVFFVNLSNPSGAQLTTSQSFGYILDDEPRVSLSNYPSGPEGNTGTSVMNFTVTLSAPYDVPVTVNYATVDWTAQAGSDYVAASGTLTFAPDQQSLLIPVTINGDLQAEANEYFDVTLTGVSAGTIANGLVYGTIVDDDTPPSITIDDSSIVEGNSGTRLLTFTVYLSRVSGNGVWVNYATANGTAKTSDNDYVAKSGTVYFAPGDTYKTITVVIKGDRKKEKDEQFKVNLSGATNATIADNKGIGTIENDDGGGHRNGSRGSSHGDWIFIEEMEEDFVNGRRKKRDR